MHIFLHTKFHVQMYQAGPSTGIFWTCKLPVCVSCSLLLSFFLSICFSLSQLTLCDFCCCCKSYINLKWKMTWPTSSGEIWKETLLLLQQTNGNFYKKKTKENKQQNEKWNEPIQSTQMKKYYGYFSLWPKRIEKAIYNQLNIQLVANLNIYRVQFITFACLLQDAIELFDLIY